MEKDFKYWAFISYSHRDKQWGEWLLKKIETYKVPGKLVGTRTRSGTVPKRLYPVFRDREELPTSDDLGEVINKGLKGSKYLIVICSPHAATSHWVNEEIRTFKAMGKANRVLALIVDGEPNVSDKPDLTAFECFPKALRHHVNEAGFILEERTEPVAADARSTGDGKRNALLKLLAGVLGIDYAVLNDRELRRRHQRRILGLAATFMAICVALGIWGIQEQRRISELNIEHARTVQALDVARNQRAKASRTLSAIYLNQGSKSLTQHTNGRALTYFLQSLRSADNTGTRVGVGMAEYGFVPEILSLKMHKGQIQDLVVSKDGLMATTGMDGMVRLWDVESLDPVYTYDSVPVGACLAFDGSNLLAASIDGVRVLNKSGNTKHLPSLACSGPCLSVLSPGKGLLAVYSPAQLRIDVVSVRSKEVMTRFDNIALASGAMAFSPDGTLLAAGGQDGRVRLLDCTTGHVRASLEGLTAFISIVSFSPDSKLLAAGEGQFFGGPGKVNARVWDIATQQTIGVLKGHEQQINQLTFSPDGKFLASSSMADKNIQVWSVEQLRPGPWKNPLFPFHPVAVLPQMHPTSALAFSPSGKVLLAGDDNGVMRLYNMDTVRTPESMFADGVLPTEFSLVAYNPTQDSFAVVAGGSINVVSLSGEKRVSIPVKDGVPTSLAYSPDGSLLTWTANKKAHVWDVKKKLSIATFEIGDNAHALALNQANNLLATADARELRVWSLADAASPKNIARFSGKAKSAFAISSVAFSPDGQVVATATTTGPRLFSLASGAELPSLGYNEPITSVAFNHATDSFLAACFDGVVRTWERNKSPDTRNWKNSTSLSGHSVMISAMSVSADGSLYATSAADAVRIWQAKNGLLLQTIPTNLTGLASVGFVDNGNGVAWFSDDLNKVGVQKFARGNLGPLLEKLENTLSLGFAYHVGLNGDLAPLAEKNLQTKRARAVQENAYPWNVVLSASDVPLSQKQLLHLFKRDTKR